MSKPFCRRCLLEDMEEGALLRTMEAYIRALPAALKVDQATYTHRLEQCKDCDALLNGMCRECGCYVQVRAIKARLGCPAPIPRWLARD